MLVMPLSLARLYFLLQGTAGLLWWLSVFFFEPLRRATLGALPLELAWADVPLFALASFLAAFWRPAVWIILIWTVAVTLAMFGYATGTREAAWGMLLMAAALGGTVLSASLLLIGRVPTEWAIQGPFVFRTTPDASGHLARALRQLVAFWTIFLVVGPLIIDLLECRWRIDVEFPPVVRIVGGVLFLFASGLGVASALTMARLGEGTPLPAAMAKRLVIAGPYRLVRNPMAVAGIGQGLAVGLMLGSWLVVVYALLGSLAWNWAIRPHEEADLASRFGSEFEAYRERVSCWWPKGYARRTS